MSECVRCSVEIEDEVLQHVYYDPKHPDIDIGPYCIDCITQVRVCSGCHKPHIIDEDIKYFGDGLHYCNTCAENIETCGHCDRIRNIHAVYEGIKYCEECFDINFTYCMCCEEIKAKEQFKENGEELTRAQYAEVFEKFQDICDSCFLEEASKVEPNDLYQCESCTKVYAVTEGAHPRYCENCLPHIHKCSFCNEKDHRARSVETRGADGDVFYGKMCPKCKARTKKCSNCGYYCNDSKTLVGSLGSQVVCFHCLDYGLKECKSCLSFKSVDENGVCSTCRKLYVENVCHCGSVRDRERSCRACGESQTHIYNYTLKPHPKFHYTKGDERARENLFIGIENEVTFNNGDSEKGAIKKLYKAYGPDYVVCKSDASVRGDGHEIVTQPMTLKFFHKFDLAPLFYRTMRRDKSCGMHVHVSRAAFLNDLHIYKVTNFIHSNEKFIDKVANRAYNDYNRKLDSKPSTYIKEAKAYGRDYVERHVRVNLRNEKTIEFRMFDHALTEYEMRYRVEFVHALVKWTQDLPLIVTDVKKFAEFVFKNEKAYPNMCVFLRKENI